MTFLWCLGLAWVAAATLSIPIAALYAVVRFVADNRLPKGASK